MKYLKLTETQEEITAVKSTNPDLPMTAFYTIGEELYFQSEPKLIKKVNEIAGENIAVVQTSETNYINQLNQILGEEI